MVPLEHALQMGKDEKGREVFPRISSAIDFSGALLEVADWFTAVPDSVFKKVIPELNPYYFSSRENHAVAMAFGARIGGKKPCVLIQNSGLGLIGDALFGLFGLYNEASLFIVSARGELSWEEIQHQHWGKKTNEFLRLLGFEVFDFQEFGLSALSKAADMAFIQNKLSAVIVHRGNIDE